MSDRQSVCLFACLCLEVLFREYIFRTREVCSVSRHLDRQFAYFIFSTGILLCWVQTTSTLFRSFFLSMFVCLTAVTSFQFQFSCCCCTKGGDDESDNYIFKWPSPFFTFKILSFPLSNKRGNEKDLKKRKRRLQFWELKEQNCRLIQWMSDVRRAKVESRKI